MGNFLKLTGNTERRKFSVAFPEVNTRLSYWITSVIWNQKKDILIAGIVLDDH